MKINYQMEMELLLKEIQEKEWVPELLLHSCCAPCSSYCLEYLSRYFTITVFYYNPNIASKEEYEKRAGEQERLIRELPSLHPIRFRKGRYEPERFIEMAKGLEEVPEGGSRCFRCYGLRLLEAAKEAKAGGYDYFTTSLTISPQKNAEKLNELGKKTAGEYGISWLPSDFKKKDGYKRSLELSEEYSLYRQNFCGCIYSMRDALQREALALENQHGAGKQNQNHSDKE